uniref:ADF-H domain-containing protein n=1 Tax=Musa acuminata subsp. malaccensis TaxID=214687 RepID=A0A804K7I0_MUSAM
YFYLVLHLLLLFSIPVHLLALQLKGIIVVFSLVIPAIRSPSVSRIRAKMLYATSKDRFRREMDGVHYEIQATDPSELDLEILRDRAH